MNGARKTGVVLGLIVTASVGCKKPVTTTDEVVAVSTVPIPSANAAPQATGIVNPGMADLTPTPVQGATNPGLIGGTPSDPSVPPMTPLPAKLPHDPGGAAPLKIVPMKIQFAVGRSIDSGAELQSDGTLFFDGRRVGKISGNKIVISKPKNAMALRSDGFITLVSPKGMFLKQDAVGITLPNGFRVRGVTKDISAIVSDAPGGGTFDYGRSNISLSDDKTRTTALLIASTEMSGIAVPTDSGAQTSQHQATTTTQAPTTGGLPLPAGFPTGDVSFGEAPH